MVVRPRVLRYWYGLLTSTDRHLFEAAADRGIAASFQYPGSPALKLVSVYLESGSPLQGPSALMITQVCTFLKAWGKEFVVGGDFNCLPSTFLRSRLTETIDVQIFAPESTSGTCKGEKGRSRVIDFFLVASGPSNAVKAVSVVPSAGMSPHSSVALEFIPRVGSTQFRKLMKGPKLPTKRVIGPLPRSKPWGRARHIAQWALWLALLVWFRRR